jgi:hypothetical protein
MAKEEKYIEIKPIRKPTLSFKEYIETLKELAREFRKRSKQNR